VKTALRKDPAGAAIVASWRRLTGGREVRDPHRRTLVAVSGGCDSSALLLALAAATDNLVAAHIVHDFRSPAEALADRDTAAGLAQRLGIPFVEGHIQARRVGGNLEAASRRLRYHELARLAAEQACPYLVTAHHADDLLETMLMRLIRGTGPAGLAPIRARRRLTGVTIVRPMLAITRADAERLCTLAGHHWATDATNSDTSRLRNDLRATVLPHLRRLSPLVSQKAAVTSELVGEAAAIIRAHARRLLQQATRLENSLAWPRTRLRRTPRIILGELLRTAARDLADGWHMDRLSHRVLQGALRAIKDHSTDPRTFEWSHLRVHVLANEVRIERT